jgi:3-deoxy-D-manno-octulosonate 8-phosphate phosphatase (KDO 8-P phosphatase)
MPLDPQDIDAIVFDFDGVLTDNRVYVFEDGREAVCCNRADGLGFSFLRQASLPAFIMSKETNPVVRARAEKLGVPALVAIDDKDRALNSLCREKGFSTARIMFVGNDINDLPALQLVGYPVAVADAHPAVRQAAKIILATRGGDGVVREIVETIIEFTPPMIEP